MIKGSEIRKADYPIEKLLLDRWSPRAMSGEEISREELMGLFEAARWAPSSMNEQPWRFVVARSEADRARFVSFLVDVNQLWAKAAPVLIVVTAKRTFARNGAPNPVHAFDAGCAWGHLAVGAAQHGLITHGMAGFDNDRAREVLGVPDDFAILAVIALGYHGNKSDLPPSFQEREVPSDRRPVAESVMEGAFRLPKEAAAEAETKNVTESP